MNTLSIPALAVLLLVSGCASKGGVKPEAVVVIEPAVRTPPATSMKPCPDLGQLEDETFGAVARKLGEVAAAYRLCERRRLELQEFIEAGQR